MDQVVRYSFGLVRQIRIKSCFFAFLAASGTISVAKGAPPRQEPQQGSQIIVSEAKRGQILAAVKSAKPEDVPELQRRSEQGDPDAQWQLGLMYLDGKGVEKNLTAALSWIHKAVDQSHPGAETTLGIAYRDGLGVPQDRNEALRWFQKAADHNYAQAQCNVGLAYAFGNGVAKDPSNAAQWFKLASEQQNACGLVWLGIIYADGMGTPKDPTRAAGLFRLAADRGDPKGQLYLAMSYDGGRGVPKDPAEAARWYRAAADQGELEAMFNLAMAYHNGDGVKKSMDEADAWFTKASEAGWAPASFYLGKMYADKKFQTSAFTGSVAIKLFEKSAEQGYPLAALQLSDIFSSRLLAYHVWASKDDDMACRWLMVARELSKQDRWGFYRPDDSATVKDVLPDRISKMEKKFKQGLGACEQWAADWMKAHPASPAK